MIEAEEYQTSVFTHHNIEDSIEQMDALEELYSIKNLERRTRKISKTKSEMEGSRRITQVIQSQQNLECDNDFVRMTFQSEEQVVSWNLLALLQEFRNMYIIGIVGKPLQIQKFIHKLTGEMLQMPRDNTDCLYFSRRWVWPQNPAVYWCFLIRYTDQRTQSESLINDVVFTIIPHLLVVFQSLVYPVSTILYNYRKYYHLIRNFTKIQQSLFLQSVKDNYMLPNEFSSIFMQTIITCANPGSLSFLDNNDLVSLLSRNVKRNYHTILTSEPITLYYLVVTLWTHMKRLLTISDSMLGSMVGSVGGANVLIKPSLAQLQIGNLNVGDLTHIYLQVLEKELRYNYKVRAEEFLKESRDQFFLYQCLKEEKEQCLTRFLKYSAFCQTQKTKIYEILCDFIRQTEIEIQKWNEQVNFKRNLKYAVDSAKNISYKLSRSMYKSSDKDLFEKDFRNFLEVYQQSCIGATSGQALFQFLRDFITLVYNYFDQTTKAQIRESVETRHLSQPQEGLQERIQMTQGLLATLQRQIADIQNRRQLIEKKRKTTEQDANKTKQAIRQARDDVQRIRRVITTDKTNQRTFNAIPMIAASQPEMATPKKRCQIF